MSDKNKFRTMDWLVGVATTVALAMGGWSFATTQDNAQRIVKLESEQRDPPRWVDDKFNALTESVAEIKGDIKEIKRELASE